MMRKSSFNVLFFIKRTKPLKDGSFPIYVRVTVDLKRVEFASKINVKGDLWDSLHSCAKGATKEAKMINVQLDNIKSDLICHKNEIEKYDEMLTADLIFDRYTGKSNGRKTLLSVFKEHNERCEGLMNKDFAPGTVERYKTCYKHVEDFMKCKYNKADVYFSEINSVFIDDFEYYLKTTRNCCNNTTIKYIKNFKKIIKIALQNNWMKTDPFINRRYHLDEVDLDYLNQKELNVLIDKKFEIDRLEQVKDIYLFSCFTGLAYIDSKQLTYENIQEENGNLWIFKKRQKTKNLCTIPILPPALAIMAKYKDNPRCATNNLVLPVLSNQKMNAYLKEIADLCGIKKKLSTHTARHTFATTVALANNLPFETTSKLIGHSDLKMTQRYARVNRTVIENGMSKLFEIYK